MRKDYRPDRIPTDEPEIKPKDYFLVVLVFSLALLAEPIIEGLF
mgnify:FL=1|jgi:hypothetical protein|tara:strand:+ start:660 stop:791 length:132 start_codon:yes stop_codon:yes gene_type:complete